MPIRAEVGDISAPGAEAVVNAANGCGIMGRGVAGALAAAGGESIEEEGMRQVAKRGNRPFKPGDCYVTDSGKLRKKGVINIYHAVTMEYPGGMTSIDFVCKALRSALDKATANGVKNIAVPGLGTGVGMLDKTTVAIRMSQIAKEYSNELNIIFVDIDKEFIDEVKRFLGAE